MNNKTIEDLIASFEANEARRSSVKRSETLRKAQAKGNKTRNRTRELERAFKQKSKDYYEG